MSTLTTTDTIPNLITYFKSQAVDNITIANQAIVDSLEIAFKGFNSFFSGATGHWTTTSYTQTNPAGFFPGEFGVPPQYFNGSYLALTGSGFSPINGGTDLDPNDFDFVINEISGKVFSGDSSTLDGNGDGLPDNILSQFKIKGNVVVVNEDLSGTPNLTSITVQAANGMSVSLTGLITLNPATLTLSAASVALDIAFDGNPDPDVITLSNLHLDGGPISFTLDVNNNIVSQSGTINNLSYDDHHGRAFSLSNLNLTLAQIETLSVAELIAAATKGNADTVISSASYILESGIENLTLTGSANINGTGNIGNNILIGNSGNNILDGKEGNDVLTGGAGNDELYGSAGNDTLLGGAGSDFLRGFSGNDSIDGGVIVDRINYTDSNTVSYSTSTGAVNVNLSGITGTGTTGTGTASDGFGGTDTLANIFYVQGSANNDTLTGSKALTIEVFEGGKGNDTIDGGLITDTLNGDNSNRASYQNASGAVTVTLTLKPDGTVTGTSSGADGIDSLSNINQVRGSAYNDSLTGSDRTDVIEQFEGRAGDDTIDGAGGLDIARYDNAKAAVNVDLSAGTATGDSSVGSDKLISIEGVRGSIYADTLTGGNLANNELESFQGLDGNDTIDGGSGYDRADYTLATTGVSVTLGGAADGTASGNSSVGTDTLRNIEGVRGSSFADTLTGSNDAGILETFEGREGKDRIDGRGGIDTADYYYAKDGVEVNLGQGTAIKDGFGNSDTLLNIENVRGSRDSNDKITGNAVDNLLEGLGGNDTLIGNAGNDTLDGGTGTDSLAGGLGNDTYRVDLTISNTVQDTATEYAHEGTDTIILRGGNAGLVTASTLILGANLDNFDASETNLGTKLNLTGNTLNNVLTGNAGNNLLNGGSGADTLIGGLGNDTYVVDSLSDVVSEKVDEGTADLMQTALAALTLADNVENLTYTGAVAFTGTGNLLANSIVGAAGNDSLNGDDGNDTLIGNAGNDTLGGEAGDDSLVGGAGNDWLEHVNDSADPLYDPGNDTLVGGIGDDTYVVDEAGATIIEIDGQGTDTVLTHLASFVLGDYLENLSHDDESPVNFTGTGNTLNNLISSTGGNDTLYGLAGNDTLDGGAGADSLAGGTGNDTYIVDDLGDVVSETSAVLTEIDLVQSAVDFTLGDNLENLTLTGSADLDGTGNALANSLIGNEGNNSLEGGAGNDTLTGNAGNDSLDGAGDIDLLKGGKGNDTYRVDLTASNTLQDTVTENANEDTDTLILRGGTVLASYSTLTLGANLENLDASHTTTDTKLNLTGNTLNNVLTGNDVANILDGGLGADILIGGLGNDALIGGLGNDTYIVDAEDSITDSGGIDTVQADFTYTLADKPSLENLTLIGNGDIDGTGNIGNNTLIGNDGNNKLDGGAGNDTLDGGAGADELKGGTGNDTYVVDDVLDTVIEETAGSPGGIDLVKSSVSFTLGANLENLTLTGSDTIDGTGNELANLITGNSADNVLDGKAGADTLIGGTGNDTYLVDLKTVGSGAAATAALQDTISEVPGITGGNDTLVLRGTAANLVATTLALATDLENLDVSATGSTLLNLAGNASANLITGNDAANILNGGLGADTLIGGLGNDTYFIDSVGDVVTEGVDAGTDRVNVGIATANLTYTLTDNVENATLTSAVAFNLTGNDLDNILIGNAANNVLDGGAGNDNLNGGTGNDTYIVDAEDSITDSGGIDTVQADFTYTLADKPSLENLTLIGNGDIDGTGNIGNNTLIGNDGNNKLDGGAGNDTLDGGAGADELKGGTGNDTYVVDDVLDTVIEETAGSPGGIDLVKSSVSFTLGANLENLTLTGSDTIDGTGNELANLITGNSADNVLDGKAGADTLIGGTGNDTYLVDLKTVGSGAAATAALQDTISEVPGITGGNDTLVLRGTAANLVATTLALATDLENLDVSATGSTLLNLAGNASANLITGNDAANILNGGLGADTLIGGLGNDTYFIDSVGDVVTEGVDAGTDRVNVGIATANLTYTLTDNVENATLTSAVAFNLTGNDLDNILIGNAANNVLDGGAGNDNLNGGTGNDTYVVDAEDSITDSGGIDTVQADFTYTLADKPSLENLTLIGNGDIDGTGNIGNNTLIGNDGNNKLDGGAGNDTLDGGAGADELKGGTGNDTYVVDDVLDTVIEETAGSPGGIDLVKSSVSFTLGANLENLTLTGSDTIDGTGNELANLITGNSADNVLDGKAGADTLIGGTGNDTYLVDLKTVGSGAAATAALQDTISEVPGITGGNDTLVLRGTAANLVATTLALATDLENLDVSATGSTLLNLAGNASANLITGNDAANILNGGLGADTLIGGLGNDTYFIDSVGDVVTEGVDAGTDRVNVGIATANLTYTLTDNVENATLTSAVAFNLTGNDLDNILIGNAANNVLDGGAGNDNLNGGTGNDTYVVDAEDSITDSGGIDTVQADFTYTLADKPSLENLTLIGNGDIDGTGNIGNNTLIGNEADNLLDGAAGIDLLKGGKGNDTYQVDLTASNTLQDTVTENANEGTDTIILRGGTVLASTSTLTLGANLENLDASLTFASTKLNLIGNALDNILTGNNTANILNGGAGADTLIGGTGNDTYIVDSTSDIVTEGVAAGTDTVISSADYTLLANLENLTLTGSAVSGTGNALANTLIGNASDNTLDGAGDIDLLKGGAGNDTYRVDLTATNTLQDTITENADEGTDTIILRGGTVLASTSTLTLGANLENLDASEATAGTKLNLTGNTLDNVLTGNDGNNTLNGGSGADTLIGGAGDDIYFIDNAGDIVTEDDAAGTDQVNVAIATIGHTYTLTANVENATLTNAVALNLTGNDLDNTLTGNVANNVLDGGAGNDTLIGGPGNDTLIGGLGNDTYIVDGFFESIIDSGGIDTVLSSVGYSMWFDPNLENLTLTGSADLYGSGNAGDNVLTGNAGNNNLNGGFGNDTLIGGLGNDYLSDNDGNNSLDGGDGNDNLNGGNGNDTLIGGLGNDYLSDNSYASFGNDILDGGDGDDTLNGGAGDDTLIGGLGNDNIYVYEGNNNLDGGDGDDTLNGGNGDDTLIGGLGNDNLGAWGVGNNILDGGDGDDTLYGGYGDDTLIGGLGNDYLSVGAGKNNLDGGDGDDTLYGGYGDDTLIGGLGNDNLYDSNYASFSNDILDGGYGDDTLDGGAGDDTLDGGAGTDFLTGGDGADVFVFNTADALVHADTLTDFVSGTDKIALSAAIFTGLGAVGDTIGLSDHLTYDIATGALAYDADGAGVVDGITFATLGTGFPPAALGLDFMIVA